MNVISYPVIAPIAQRIHEARTLRQSVQLSPDQVTLLDEWMRHELELQADSEWLARAAASDDQADFVGLDEAEGELAALTV